MPSTKADERAVHEKRMTSDDQSLTQVMPLSELILVTVIVMALLIVAAILYLA